MSYGEVYNKYKFWSERGKQQGYHSRTYFAFENMKAKINEILENNVSVSVGLNLPPLKKITKTSKLPTLKKA